MAPTLLSLSPPPKLSLFTSILLPHLPCTSSLVPIMVWWWGMTPMCPFSDFKKSNHVPANFWKFFFGKMDLPLQWFCSSFWKVKILLKIRQFPNREICFNGHDIHMGGQGIIWGARWCGFYLGRLAVTAAGWLWSWWGRRILVSKETNHSYQPLLITIKPPPLCRALCGEYNGVMFMVGGWV